MAHYSDNKTMLERFEEKVDKSGDCWEWTAGKHNRGYGYFYTSKEYSPRKMDYAHRVSKFLYDGERDDNLCLRHKCDNTSCVNPAHLEWGEHKDNMRDMVDRKRMVCPNQKLTKEDCEEAIRMREAGMMIKDIATHFDIDTGHASRVTRSRRKYFNNEG